MQLQLLDTRVYEDIASLLDYPIQGRNGLAEMDRRRIEEASPEAAESVAAFISDIGALDPGEREELYVRTFDFAPLCAPYVGAHLFGGGDGFKRSALMAALAGVYRHAGFHFEGELPDHLAVILRFRGHLSPGEWEDMVRCCLLPAARRMHEELERAASPYRHVLRALERLLSTEFSEES